MRVSIKHYTTTVYRRTTRDTITGTWVACIAIILAIVFLSSFMFGVVAGASVALDGGVLAAKVAAVQSVETQVWSEMLTDGSSAARAVYGLFHWAAVLAGWLGMVGIRLGYSLPNTGYAVKYIGSPIIWALWLVLALQLVRVVELVYHESRLKRGTHG